MSEVEISVAFFLTYADAYARTTDDLADLYGLRKREGELFPHPMIYQYLELDGLETGECNLSWGYDGSNSHRENFLSEVQGYYYFKEDTTCTYAALQGVDPVYAGTVKYERARVLNHIFTNDIRSDLCLYRAHVIPWSLSAEFQRIRENFEESNTQWWFEPNERIDNLLILRALGFPDVKSS